MSLIDTWKEKSPLGPVRALMGWGGLVVHDDSVDVLDMLRAYMEKAAEESCGQCFPCRMGLKKIAARLADLCQGISQPDDVQYLSSLAQSVAASARCDIGQTSPQPLLDVIEHAPDLLKARKVKAGKYASLVTAPCVNACPGHVDIPRYIEKIRLRQFDAGFETVMQRCPMPGSIGRVCERPCETACKRGLNGSPVAIRHLKRFLFDKNIQNKKSSTALHEDVKIPTISQKQKIAVIGAGPAGLSCAYHLLQHGFSVTIFERQEYAGGMAKYGIPDYRLPPAVLEEEVQYIQSLGCEIRYGVDVGADITLPELEKQGYEVIFIGTGAPETTGMQVDGEETCHTSYISGIHYLSETTKGRQVISGKSLVVVGGGNVAMDCVRTALRHGFTDVQIVYRRTEQEMPADKAEIHEAKLEGVNFTFLAAPIKLLTENGCVSGIVCQKMCLGEPDASGRCRPVPIEGETFEILCDVVIHAIGQKTAVDLVLTGLDGGLSKWNTLDAHDITGKVHDFVHVFGGGDCVTGPSTLIKALAAGRRAALHIVAQLQKLENPAEEHLAEFAWTEKKLVPANIVQDCEPCPPKDYTETMPIHTLDVDDRLQGFAEVEKGSADWEAQREASRCLRCFRILMVAQ